MLPALMLRTKLPTHRTQLRSDVASFEGLGFAPRPSLSLASGASTTVLRQYRTSDETLLTLLASTTVHPGIEEGGRSMRVRVSKRGRIVLVAASLILFVLLIASRKYISLYITRKPDPRPGVADLLGDSQASRNPDTLLAEANRLAWLFNWPKAEPLYARAEQL